MSSNNTLSLFTFLTISISLIVLCGGHSFLIDPPPFDQTYVTKECRERTNYLGRRGSCDQACPNYPSRRAKYTHRNPIRTYKRGEDVQISWAKNNHHGGFMAVGLTPFDQMMDKEAHKKFYLYYGCWEQKRVRCRNNEPCGTDNEVFVRKIQIPTVIPDGVYVFSWVWFGGLQFMRDHGQFPDYHSCAFVRIRGGAPLDTKGSYQPFFQPGETGKRAVNGRCHAAIDAPGLCPVEGCDGPKYPREVTVPKAFKNSRQPAALNYLDFAGEEAPSASPSSSAAPSTSSSSSATPSPSVSIMAMESATTSPSASPLTASPAPSESTGTSKPPSKNFEPFNTDYSAGCVFNDLICCVKSCGQCGGKKCKNLPGGPNNCCRGKIKRSKRICGRDPPPCRVVTSASRVVESASVKGSWGYKRTASGAEDYNRVWSM